MRTIQRDNGIAGTRPTGPGDTLSAASPPLWTWFNSNGNDIILWLPFVPTASAASTDDAASTSPTHTQRLRDEVLPRGIALSAIVCVLDCGASTDDDDNDATNVASSAAPAPSQTVVDSHAVLWSAFLHLNSCNDADGTASPASPSSTFAAAAGSAYSPLLGSAVFRAGDGDAAPYEPSGGHDPSSSDATTTTTAVLHHCAPSLDSTPTAVDVEERF